MSVRRANATTKKINRGSSIPENNKKIKPNPVQTKKPQNKDSKIIDKKRNIKVDYNSNNYFYDEEEDYYNDYIYNKIDYYDRNQKSQKYNNETNDSYVTVEQEDGHIKYIPKNYVEYKGSSPPLYNNKNIQYYENSEDSDHNYNNENDNMYYENEDEYDQEMNQSPVKGYNQFKGINKYYLTQDNNENKIKKNNQNVISRPINHQINFTNKDMKRKGRTPGGNVHNCGNNTTTTNNTYNNNIYYINPINVKNKNKKEEINNKVKRATTNKKNSVYKNVDITINKKKPKEKDYFRINNIERSQRQKFINAAILIQSIFRGYLIKIKLYNNVNLYVCCKRSIDILEKIIFKRKKYYWKIYKNIISHMFYNDLLNSKVSLNILKEYLKTNKNYSKERKKVTSFHKELGDSFNIVVDIKQKENNEKKLKSKLNDVIKENKELKNQLNDYGVVEEKMKNLIDENKKNQNINAIIMKDNQQLAKKLKDIQDYRNTNLFVENQPSVDLTQKQQMQIEELIINNEININKLKKYLLGKIINKKINTDKNIIKDYFNKYKNIIEKAKNKDIKKNIYLKNCLDNIENKFKLIKKKYFWYIHYEGLILNNDIISNNNHKHDLLKKAINNKEKNIKIILYKNFLKYYSNIIQLKKEKKLQIEEENEQDKELSKTIILNKIFKKYQKNIKLIYKIFIEKWNLKSKIIGMRAAARDKKKKRKLKKKNNKLLYEKHFGIAEKKPYKNNLGPTLCKSIHEFSYIVSNGAVIKESSSNENAEINIKNKNSTSSDKINKTKNKLDKKNFGIKKTNSFNEIAKQNKLKKDSKEDNKENENININEESEEDSGDSFGLEDNNSD